VARERNRVVREIGARKNREFRQRFVGTTVDAITLQAGDEQFTEALSDNYLKIKLIGRYPANRWMNLEVKENGMEDMVAVVAEKVPYFSESLAVSSA
jgi:tRNA A37 methylthiotransferase MiaB